LEASFNIEPVLNMAPSEKDHCRKPWGLYIYIYNWQFDGKDCNLHCSLKRV